MNFWFVWPWSWRQCPWPRVVWPWSWRKCPWPCEIRGTVQCRIQCCFWIWFLYFFLLLFHHNWTRINNDLALSGSGCVLNSLDTNVCVIVAKITWNRIVSWLNLFLHFALHVDFVIDATTKILSILIYHTCIDKHK